MMHFDETGKYVKFADMHNSESYVFDDHLSKSSNGACKKICLQYVAKRTSGGSRYDVGQSRCQVCDIYITVEGTVDEKGLACKCCHYRVRNKPRNKVYKEKLRNKQENKPEIDVTNDVEASNYVNEHRFSSNVEPDIDTNDDYSNMDDDSSEKKSAPVYEEIDESVKIFYELKEFLDTIHLQSNYQLVMLKELIEYGPQHKGELAESLAYFNNKDTTNLDAVKYYFDVPVYDVLLNHGFVITTGYAYHRFPIYKLNVQLNQSQKIGILEIINDKLNEYNKLHEISENEFPNSDNRGNIEWDSENIFQKFKSINHSDPELSQKIFHDQQEKIAKDTSEGVIGKIYRNLTRKIHTTHSKWIWSVTPENWEILKSQNVWGSRIGKERIGEKVQSGDQVAFYVIGTSNFKGIFEFVGDWYDSPGKTWNDDLRPDGSLIYVSQIQIKPIQLGSVKIHTLHEKLDVFIGKSQNNRNLVLQAGSGYPSNNSKPLSGDDFTIIRTELMRNQDDLSENSSIIEEKIIRNRIKFSKSCPKCAVTKVTASLRQEFEEKIEESFGYRSNDSDKKIPQSWCRGCRSSQNQTNEKLKESDSILLHICSDCKETKIEGIPGLELDKKIEEFFGTRPSYLLNSPESRKINAICRNCRRLYSQDYRTKIKNEMIDQELEKLDSISDVTDTKIFNFDDGVVNIQNCKILSTDTIKKDQILTNDEIISTFKVGNMGGIRYTKYNNIIVLLSTHSNDYDDSMDLNSGFIIYTGEGKGDQEIKNGNEKILNSQNTPMIYFKEVYQEPGVRIRGALDNKYKFIGVVKYHKYNWATEKGRKVIKFVLEIVS